MVKEADIQKGFVKWFRLQYPHVVGFAVPNEGQHKIQYRVHQNQMGVLAGVPDFIVAARTEEYGGLFMEFKTPEGHATKSQEKVQGLLVNHGYKVETIRTIEQGMMVVNEYMEGVRKWMTKSQ